MIVTLTYSDLPFSLTFQPSPRPVKLDVESFTTDLSLLDQLPECGFAIVGTRTPQRRSFELLEKTMADLRGSNLVIISGLARGIDSRAHELAIEHGLKTIAILGNGIDIDYPRENRHLRKKIVEHGGMVISQFERQMAPIKYNFIHRNQLIAGLSSAVWVVEAAAISGTLNTAKHAASFNRDLYATPCFPGDPFFQGNEKLLSEQHPDRYPIAKPFFGSHSLSPTWRELMQGSSKQTDFFGSQNRSPLQTWVAELKSEFGECQVQALMNHAYSQGLTLGKFYLQFEKEIEEGLIRQDSSGRVDLQMI